ncbi:hypothetical protein PHOBOS_176 [Erwinia phage vB_EamM_Phobos]|uniref:hypothetical protein n=1 Tax=Erwinia phage vB_EamM_Phobos TaxID=1883377 RepID=UPI00081C2FFF|nr:hypothetical protein BIZ79_gp176 [Erwinia phage vB_EamM_Phobos]ANZ50366.1 hypothetical protein PHOBOS_176 [Erwinia phage vB_EamM_Phobos]
MEQALRELVNTVTEANVTEYPAMAAQAFSKESGLDWVVTDTTDELNEQQIPQYAQNHGLSCDRSWQKGELYTTFIKLNAELNRDGSNRFNFYGFEHEDVKMVIVRTDPNKMIVAILERQYEDASLGEALGQFWNKTRSERSAVQTLEKFLVEHTGKDWAAMGGSDNPFYTESATLLSLTFFAEAEKLLLAELHPVLSALYPNNCYSVRLLPSSIGFGNVCKVAVTVTGKNKNVRFQYTKSFIGDSETTLYSTLESITAAIPDSGERSRNEPVYLMSAKATRSLVSGSSLDRVLDDVRHVAKQQGWSDVQAYGHQLLFIS